jgi:hypothetical protein
MATKRKTTGRRKDGRFTKGSTAAKRAGRRGGLTTARKNASCHRKRKTTKRAKSSKQRSLRLK